MTFENFPARLDIHFSYPKGEFVNFFPYESGFTDLLWRQKCF